MIYYALGIILGVAIGFTLDRQLGPRIARDRSRISALAWTAFGLGVTSALLIAASLLITPLMAGADAGGAATAFNIPLLVGNLFIPA